MQSAFLPKISSASSTTINFGFKCFILQY